MLFFKDKKLIQFENILKNPKETLKNKMDTLAEYILYLRDKKDKKEGEIFLEIIKAFKDKTNQKIFIGKDLFYLNDKKNNRVLLNAEFLKVMKSFTQTQMMVFASTMEGLENFLDFFVNEKGNVLRFDFKNIIPMKSIDLELYNKRSNKETNSKITKFLSNKNIFILDESYIEDAELLEPKFFYEMMPYMGEKTYPVLYRDETGEVVDFMDIKNIERRIQNNASYISWGLFLENSSNINIKLDNEVVTIPFYLLNRNSNFYIKENKRTSFF